MTFLLDLTPAEQAEIFEATSQDLGVPAHVLEKDFWVTCVLDVLFNHLNDLPVRMLFKGGTSLSKCYQCISRFSEDIDLSLSREDLGFADEKAPENQASNTQERKTLKALKLAGTQYISETLFPAILEHLNDALSDEFELWIDENNPENILFAYPKCLGDEHYSDSDYVKPIVLIETGTKSAHDPSEEIEVCALFCESDLLEQTDLDRDKHTTTVNSLCVSRTFWEKVTFVHQQCCSNDASKVKDRLSRHLYDIHQIYCSDYGKGCLEDLELLRQVAAHKAVYFKQSGVDYHAASTGRLDLSMSDELRGAFSEDYARMDEMIYGDKPEFESLLESLSTIEEFVNRASNDEY